MHSYDAAGIYEVTLTVTDFGQNIEGGESSTACGCSDSITFTVEVLEGQGPIIESDCCDGTVCPGETSTFYTNVVCTTYNWSVTGGTIIAGAGTSQIEVEWDATYSVPTTVSLETPGCADTPCAGITTVGVPVLYPNLPISGDTNLCQGTNGTYSIPSMPGTYYTWTVSGGDYSINNSDLNSSHINVSFTSPGTFTIEVEYDNPLAGCSGSSSVVVETKPLFTLLGEDLVCENSKELYLANGDVSSWLVTPAGPAVDPISSASAEITWDNAGIYLVSAEAANPALFCNTTAIQQVEVVTPPVLDPIVGLTEVCPDTYLTYFISSDTEGSFFNWSILPAGSGTIFSEMGADKDSIVVAFHGAGPWTLEVYQETEVSPGVTCISDIETLVVEAQAPPVISSQSNNTTVCVDAVETYFTALPVPIDGFTWEINPPNRGTIVSGQGTEEVEIRWHGPPANATLSVSSCAGSDQVVIEIIDPPLIDWIFPDGPTLYCLPDTPSNLTLSTSLDPNFTYQWYLDGVPIPGATGHEYTITSLPAVPQEYLYEVVASNGACTKTRERLVVVENCGGDPPPPLQCDLDFTFNPDPACVGQPVSFNATSFPPNYDFAWGFGDNSTSFTQNTEKAFNAPGIYEVTLTGTWFDQCSLVVVKQVEVNPLPSCEVFATDTIFCPGDSLLLEACQGMTGYQWYREGNPIPGADQQTYWATQHGLYQVEATNQFGCSDLSEGVYIFSHSLPRAKISGEQSICVNPGWFFNMELSTPYDPDYSYEWSSSLAGTTFNPNNGNNAASTNAQFQLPNPLPPQISFYVSVTDMTTGCVNTDTLCVTVNQTPFVEFTWQSACEGTPVTFTPSVIDTSQYHYLWSNGATTPEITVSTPGFYILQITDKFNGCSNNAFAGIINPIPDVSLFPTGCETIEVDEVLDLYVPLPLSSTAWNNTIPIAYPSIEWFDTNGNSLGSGENLAFSSSTDGYFEVYAVIENVFGCEATTVVFCITVLPKPGDPEPAITVTKTLADINGTDQTAFTQVGDVLTYNIVVCNTGNVTLFNVGVIDPFTGLNEIINQLDAGDCATFTTSYTITQDDLDLCEFENIVVVSGEDENENEVTDMDVETVPCEDTFVPEPGLTVTKTLADINGTDQTAFTQVGDVLTYNIVVCNTGNVTLFNVMVEDPLTGMSENIAQLAPGDCETFTTTYTITQGDLDSCNIRNIVTATGDDPDGNQVNDSDFVDVPCDQEAQNPEIEVTKSLDNINGTDQTAFTQVGDVLTYNIVVCNTGTVTLLNIVVADPLTGMSENISQLAPGDCVNFTTSYTITIDDLSHCEVVNVVDASGNTQDGTQVVDTDEETVPCEDPFVPEPGLTVTKTLASINDDPNQTAFTQVGDILTFTIVVTNTGNVPLNNVVVDDPVTGDTWTIPVLNPGDSQTFTTTYVITQGDLDSCTLRNIVTVTGEDPDGNQLDDIDIVTVPCDQEAQNPEIEVTKSLDNINGTDQTAFTQVGDVLTYNIVVCNTGTVTLLNIVVADPLTGMSENISQLAPGDCETFTTSYTITIDDLSHCEVVNVVDASGNTQDGTQVVDTDEETVPCEEQFIPNPGLTVTKTLASINDDPNQTAFTQVGDILTFTIVVTNTGNVPLTNVVVDDPVTGDTWTIPVLNPGDSQTFTTTYTITQGELDNCVIRNFVNATGDDPDGNQVSDGDVISVPCDPEGQYPDISVTKNLSDINGDSSITSYTQVGDVLTYTIVVTNTGSVTLFNVVVTDPLTGLSQNIPVMAPGDSVTLTTSYTITQADLDNGYVLNTVTAVGQDQFGNTVSDDDFEIVPGCIEELHPQLTVNKVLSYINESADQTNFTQVGDVLIYTITVVNTGNITLTNVVITDPMTGLNYTVPGSLAPGDSVSVTTSYTIQQFDLDKCFLLNLGYATGEDPYGFVVSHGDFEIVECEEDTGLYDFGDAPEGAIAYPPSTIGFFPTCTNSGPPGSFIRHSGNHELFFGESVDYEFDGNAGNCPTFSPNLYDQDECFEDGDAGLITPRAYTITGPVGSESIVPCTAGWSWLTWFTCSQAVWGRTVDIYVTNNLPNGATAYVNLLVDWNMSGEWGGAVPCSGNNLAHEHALVNFPVPNGFSGPLSQLSPPNFRIGPEAGYVWTRFSVTDTPVVQDWDGSGSFDFGETEDYLIRTRPLIVIPVDWVIGGVSVALGEEVCFSALDNIVAGGEEGPFVVENGGFAELGAGRSISLQPGVRVEAGGYLHARIVTDDDYCIWEEGVETAAEPVGPAETIEGAPVPDPLELPETFGFRVFPNPTNGMLNVELLSHSDSQNIRIEIYNMMGIRVLWKEEAVASHYELDLSSQQPGMYFIRVSDGTATDTQRVVRR